MRLIRKRCGCHKIRKEVENDINNPSGIISQVLDVVSNFRSYCEGVDVNSSTCDIMQKELNEKYKSFK